MFSKYVSGVWIEGCFPSATSNIPVFVSQRTGSVTFEAKKRRYGETKHRFRRCYTFEKPQCNHTLIICLQKQEERLKIKFIMVGVSQLQVFSGHSFCIFVPLWCHHRCEVLRVFKFLIPAQNFVLKVALQLCHLKTHLFNNHAVWLVLMCHTCFVTLLSWKSRSNLKLDERNSLVVKSLLGCALV